VAASRCAICNISFPHDITKCVVCDEPLLLSPFAQPDENWEDLARVLLGENPEYMFFFIELYPHRADNNVPLTLEADQLWVKHTHALEAGYMSIEDGMILYLNNIFYEVQGWSERRKSWWVLEIDPEKEFEDMPLFDADALDA